MYLAQIKRVRPDTTGSDYMATTKLWPIKGGSGSTGVVIKTIIDYVENPEKTEKDRFFTRNTNIEVAATISNVISYSMQQSKTEEERFVSAVNCSVKNAISEMMDTKRQWNTSGNRLMWHGYQSFAPGEVNPEEAHEIGVKLAKELFGDRFEVVVATHLDRQHIHNHFVINAVSFLDGKKLDWDTIYPQMKLISDRLCREHSLSVVEADENSGHYHRGAIRAETEGRPTLETIMIEDVDACILAASSVGNFYQLMESKGYRIDASRKYLRIYPPGHSKCIRLDRRMRDKYNQGDAYTIEGIENRILANLERKEAEGISGGDVLPGVDMLPGTEVLTSDGSLYDELIIPDNQDDYYTEKGLPKGKSVSGIGAFYIRYMFRMGVYPVKSVESISRSHYYFREDVLKLDKYINETKLLIDNDIVSLEDLVAYKGEHIKELNSLNNQRSKIQNRMRRCKNEDEKKSLSSDITRLNKEIKDEKRTLFYCNDIMENQKNMKRKTGLVNCGSEDSNSAYIGRSHHSDSFTE